MTNTFPRGAVIVLLLPIVAGAQRAPRAVEIAPGMVITTSVRVVAKRYRLAAPRSLDSAVIVVRGSDITIDFAGATMEGIAPGDDPDVAAGVAIRIEGGSNVTLKGAHIRGYKVAVMARGTRRLTLVDNDLSYNWKPRLFSVVEHESLADWLSFHHNEKDEWLRFGAAAYLVGVRGGELRGNRVEQGMNGLLLVRSDSLRIWNNVLAFNSGLGIGLYRSSDNVIMHNHVDYNVRGYSHGFYRRGQDSADLLVYEQSCRNVVAYNSMTHGGDGLFLWAGQTTMDTGEGGANDNLFYGNDFSFAPTNGMEATFSRNSFIANRVEGSDYGLWGGYSFDSRVIGNQFTGNRTGVAIEHGQDNTIIDNRFDRDTVALYLWANPVEPSDWVYPKRRDTRSRDYAITGNLFIGNRVALRAANTTHATIAGNAMARVDSPFVLRDTSNVRLLSNEGRGPDSLDARRLIARDAPDSLRDGLGPNPSPLVRRDRSAIVVNEWGPYDWRSPLLWPVDSAHATPMRLRVLGPAGSWRAIRRTGAARIAPDHGRVGDTLLVTPAAGAEENWSVTLEYRGEATVSPQGTRRAAGIPYDFSYERFNAMASWTVAFHTWNDSTDPRTKPDAFHAEALRAPPIATRETPRIDYMWYRPTIAGLPQARFAAVATTTVNLAPGTYTLRTISDDGIRVWVDGVLVIDNWSLHESAVDAAPLTAGHHALRVEYFQVDGWMELRVEIVKGAQRSTGSPGPH